MLVRLALFILVACGLLTEARAAVLIEARAGEEDLRLVIDRASERVLVRRDGTEALFDLARGEVYLWRSGSTPERRRVRFRPGHEAPPPYRLEVFGPGPVRAGHASVYHVLFVEDRVCAEVLVSGWMRPFVDPAVRALAMLEQLEGWGDGADPCAEIPITTLAAAGWPIMAGKLEQPAFETREIRFDYTPAPDELATPAPFRPAEAVEGSD